MDIDISNKHLSGLLFIKTMPDSSIRTVCSSETGLTFFDFKFVRTGEFEVKSIFEKMNRRSIISSIRKDFELLFMNVMEKSASNALQDDHNIFYLFPDGNKNVYVITDLLCSRIEKIELTSSRKKKVILSIEDYFDGIPGFITIIHKDHDLKIAMKRIEQ